MPTRSRHLIPDPAQKANRRDDLGPATAILDAAAGATAIACIAVDNVERLLGAESLPARAVAHAVGALV